LEDKEKKVLRKVREKLSSVVILDTLPKYKEALNKYRELSRYYVCYIDEWPAEALLNISGVNISSSKMREVLASDKEDKKYTEVDLPKLIAEVFVTANKVMQSSEESSISIKRFKSFIKIFERMHETRNNCIASKLEFYTNVYTKFHDACILIVEWEKRVDVLKVELEEAITRLDEELRANRQETSTFAELYAKREEEEQLLSRKNIEMGRLEKKMEMQL
jgi:hypothetical protein